MASYMINVPPAIAADLVLALTADWSPTGADGRANPITREQAAANAIVAMIKTQLVNYRQIQAQLGVDTSDPGITVQ